MQVTDDLIRSVVQQVLTNLRNGSSPVGLAQRQQQRPGGKAAAASSATSESRRVVRCCGCPSREFESARTRRPPCKAIACIRKDLHRAGRAS